MNAICPRCGSTRVKRSHSKSLKERVLKFFNERAYRCINCGWRGILEGKSSRVRLYVKKYTPFQITIIDISFWTMKEEPKPIITSQSSTGTHTEKLVVAADFSLRNSTAHTLKNLRIDL